MRRIFFVCQGGMGKGGGEQNLKISRQLDIQGNLLNYDIFKHYFKYNSLSSRLLLFN